MKKFLFSGVGRLRIMGLLEGISLLLLVLVAMPLKYLKNDPYWVKTIGPVHGVLFILFVLLCFLVAGDRKWSFTGITWKLVLSSFIPFGTFYVDHQILRHEHAEEEAGI